MAIRLKLQADQVQKAIGDFRGPSADPLAGLNIPTDVFVGGRAVVGWSDGTKRHATLMRWGVPPFSGKRLIGHVANLASVFWRPWLKSPWRAVVPVSAFAEWGAIDNRIHWFSDPRNRSLWLAAVWRPISGKRTSTAPDPNDEPAFALVNSPANRLVAASHPSSMPTLLRTSEIDTWLHAPREIATELKRPSRVEDLQERLER
jgi:putative SOS response-associated peptidase YedK